mgnify:CR=1 FL=1
MAGHTPYGYKIVDAKAVIDEPAAEKLRQLYLEYVECGSMRAAAVKVGIKKTHSVIGRILSKELYTGTEYYPEIIDKELFDKVQSKIKDRTSALERQNKEFAFTKLLTCGLCGSGITADEKYKKLKNGEIKKYIYDTCTKEKDKNYKR